MSILALEMTPELIRFPIAGVFIGFGSSKIWRDGVLWTKNKRIVGKPAKVIAAIGFAIALSFIVAGLLSPFFVSHASSGAG